jgi:hypothetical protein
MADEITAKLGCAVVQKSDNVVINIIMADPGDNPQEGCFLVPRKLNQHCGIGWVWNGTDFVDPNASTSE